MKLYTFSFSKIFYIDARLDKLSSMSYDGTDHQTITKSGIIKHPFALSIFEDMVYFTDWSPGSIKRMSKLDGSVRSILKSELKKPMDIQVIQQMRQPRDERFKNHCASHNCSHLCVMKPNGFSCKCPFGRQLKPGTHDCESKFSVF